MKYPPVQKNKINDDLLTAMTHRLAQVEQTCNNLRCEVQVLIKILYSKKMDILKS
jgi:hypothetical protein